MKFLLLSSAAALAAPARGAAQDGDAATKIPRTNEMTLLGLQPGRDTLAAAERRIRMKQDEHSTGAMTEWRDPCTGHAIKLKVDAKGVIQSVTISAIAATPAEQGVCSGWREKFLDEKNWQTGHGLRLGDSQDRVSELYGDSDSAGASEEAGRPLEVLHYAFDWAGKDVPQVMEILCARESGRVMEITLTYPGS